MREILFKAKRKGTGEWIKGFYCKYGNVKKEKHYIVPNYASDLYAFEVDENTLCQYTGTVDRYGKYIWENDFIKEGCNGLVSFVVWDNRTASYKLKDFGDDYTIEDAHIEWEVIGNIFDNPEL